MSNGHPSERSTMYRKNSSTRTCPDLSSVEGEWLSWIEGEYGVVLGDGQLYADTTGRVYAGSEYVARLNGSLLPQDATEWTEHLSHRPRGTHRLETARRA